MKLVPIEQIKKVDKCEHSIVYDLSVEDDLSYNIDGVIVHNSVCSTKNKTGFTYPMYSCVTHVFDTIYDLTLKHDETPFPPIIADGGIRENGDIAKAIHAGATMVMAGSIFSKLLDSPADIIDGHKIYFGSASEFNKGFRKNVEGVKKSLEMVPMTYEQKLLEITEDLQSSISYAGGIELMDIRNCKHVIVSSWEV